MKHYQMYIDGEWCDAGDGTLLESINPATGEIWATAAVAGEAEVNRAVAAASRALKSGPWAEMNATQRGKLLRRLGDMIGEKSQMLGEIETIDSGKLGKETRAQTGYVSDYYYYYAGLADKIQGATLPIDKPDMHVYTKRVPIGVVAAVVPWNAQMFLTATKLGPALAAGNTVVLKASEAAPAPMFEFAKIVEEAGFPPGVINVITGYGEPCGRLLTSHPDVARVAFTGGMNIGREYRYVWHDMMVETRGPVVDILGREFYDAWAYAGPAGDVGYFFHKLKAQREVAEDVGHPMRVLFTRTGDAEIFRAQREAIRNAKRYIFIQNAYFSDDAMLYELARARRRGVDVRVILPLVSNHGAMNQSNVLAANAMLEHGIRVFLYPGMSHIKAAVFDGWACLGSANWDKLSFRTNRELNLATSYPEAVDELLDRIFTEDFASSVELTEAFPARWSDHLMELVADYAL